MREPDRVRHGERIGLHGRRVHCQVARARVPELPRVGRKGVHVPTDAVGRVTYRLYEDHARALVVSEKTPK